MQTAGTGAFEVVRELGLATTERDSAYYISNSLYLLQLNVGKRGAPISIQERDQLLAALSKVGQAMQEVFQSKILPAALEAAAVLICHWAETEEQRSLRDRQVLHDANAYVRWLRNTFHNLSILDNLAPRMPHRFPSPICAALWDACVGSAPSTTD